MHALHETICYKLVPMTGTGWIRVSFVISGHFPSLVGSENDGIAFGFKRLPLLGGF